MQNSNSVDWFEIAKFIVEIVLTIVAVAISVIALWQTKKQIQLSNKQILFERRIKSFTIIAELLIHCNRSIEKNESIDSDVQSTTKLLNTIIKSPPLHDLMAENDIETIDCSSEYKIPDSVFIFLRKLLIEVDVVFDDSDIGQVDLIRSFVETIYNLLNFGSSWLALNKNTLEIKQIKQEIDTAGARENHDSLTELVERNENKTNKTHNRYISEYQNLKTIIARMDELKSMQYLKNQMVLNR